MCRLKFTHKRIMLTLASSCCHHLTRVTKIDSWASTGHLWPQAMNVDHWLTTKPTQWASLSASFLGRSLLCLSIGHFSTSYATSRQLVSTGRCAGHTDIGFTGSCQRRHGCAPSGGQSSKGSPHMLSSGQHTKQASLQQPF